MLRLQIGEVKEQLALLVTRFVWVLMYLMVGYWNPHNKLDGFLNTHFFCGPIDLE